MPPTSPPSLQANRGYFPHTFFDSPPLPHTLPLPLWLCAPPSLQANRGSFPHTFFFETPAEHPKDNNGQTCAPMTGEGGGAAM